MPTMWCILLMIPMLIADDTFLGFDCTNPSGSEFFDHKICHKHTDRLVKSQFEIIQNREVDHLDGYYCQGEVTSVVGYCGRYSHNKFTGQDSYSVPLIFNQDTCRMMIEKQIYNTGSQTMSIKVGSQNTLKTFTHGSVTFDGTNIACTGGELRLEVGTMNTNMIQQVHYNIKVFPTKLIISNSEVIDPYTQINLGPLSLGYSTSSATTYVWDPTRPKCDKLKVMSTTFESAIPGIWFSDHHQIQVRVTDSYYDQSCKIKLWNTDTPGLYLSSTPTELDHVSSKDVDISMDLRIRFDYVNNKIFSTLSLNYKSRHPMCSKLNYPIDSIVRIGDSTFIRNLGEASVEFTCNKIEVAPVMDKVCHTMMKVVDHDGKPWFLESVTRILFHSAVVIPCGSARVPVYRNTKSQLVTYAPDRKVISTSTPPGTNVTTPSPDAPGMYPLIMVKNWLQYAWLQHLSKHSYSFISQAVCQSPECQQAHTDPGHLLGMIGQVAHNASKILTTKFWLGIDIEAIGRRCSIAVCIILAIYIVYGSVTWCMRYAMFRGENVGMFALAIRSTFPEMFLIAKATADKKVDTNV